MVWLLPGITCVTPIQEYLPRYDVIEYEIPLEIEQIRHFFNPLEVSWESKW